jgi:hypothetical protein
MAGSLTVARRSADLEARRLSARTVSLAGALAAGRAATFALLSVTVVVLVGWATAADTGASATEALSACLHTWLVAHHTELVTSRGSFALAPLGLTLVCGWLLFTGGTRAAQSCGIKGNRGAAALTCAIAATYALLGALLAVVARTDAVRPLPVSAFLGAGAVAAIAGGAGAIRGAGTWRGLWRRLPVRLAVAAEAAAGATAVLLSAGALLVTVALAAKFSRVLDLVQSLGAGTLGVVLLGVLSLAYVPTGVVWASAYVLGPGFAVGSGTSVSLAGTTLGATPAFPPLAALPAGGNTAAPAWALLLVPVGAGIVAGLLLDRASRRRTLFLLTSWRHVVLSSAAAGACTGVVLLLAAFLTDGPGGPGRLGDVGAPWWQVGPAAAGWVTLFAAITLFARRRSLLPRPWAAELRRAGRSARELRSGRSSGIRFWQTR